MSQIRLNKNARLRVVERGTEELEVAIDTLADDEWTTVQRLFIDNEATVDAAAFFIREMDRLFPGRFK